MLWSAVQCFMLCIVRESVSVCFDMLQDDTGSIVDAVDEVDASGVGPSATGASPAGSQPAAAPILCLASIVHACDHTLLMT